MKRVIFDIGSHDGLDGIILAFLNPRSIVYSFEPNLELNKVINKNKKKLQKFFNVKINNHKIINFAVSNINSYKNFYINRYKQLSSLKKFNKNFSNPNDLIIQKTIKTKVIRLDSFCKKEKIDVIEYIHIDTQGSDLQVLEGLGKYRKKIISGVLETSVSKNNNRYINESNFADVKKKFRLWNFDIKDIQSNNNVIEFNVYFINNKNNHIRIKANTRYNERFFRRVVKDKMKLKDYISKFYIKFFR